MLRNFVLLIYVSENEETNVRFSSSLKEKRKFAHLRFDDIGKPKVFIDWKNNGYSERQKGHYNERKFVVARKKFALVGA